MNGMTLGRYLPIDSYIHRLDPRLKISALILLLVVVFFDAGFVGYGILAVLVMLMAYLSKLRMKQLIKSIKPMMFMMGFLLFFNLFFVKTGNVVLTLGPISIYDQAIIQSLYIFIRLILIIIMTTILKAIEIIIATSCVGNPTFLNGDNKCSIPKVKSNGFVVAVRIVVIIIININLINIYRL